MLLFELDFAPFFISGIHPEYLNDTYVDHNLALVHLHFQKLHFIRHLRSELFGLTDFFATIGGLLGLSMGFSVLSLVEIVYFLVLRLLCKAVKHTQQEGIGEP